MSLTQERPNPPMPADPSHEQVQELIKTVRYYGNPDNYVPELMGEFEPSPEGSEIEQDRGARARKTLKEMGLK